MSPWVSLTDRNPLPKQRASLRLGFSLPHPSFTTDASRGTFTALPTDSANVSLHFRQSPSSYRAKHVLQASVAFQNDRDGVDGRPRRRISRPYRHGEKRHPRPWHDAFTTQTRIRMLFRRKRLQPAEGKLCQCAASSFRPVCYESQIARRLACVLLAHSGAHNNRPLRLPESGDGGVTSLAACLLAQPRQTHPSSRWPLPSSTTPAVALRFKYSKRAYAR